MSEKRNFSIFLIYKPSLSIPFRIGFLCNRIHLNFVWKNQFFEIRECEGFFWYRCTLCCICRSCVLLSLKHSVCWMENSVNILNAKTKIDSISHFSRSFGVKFFLCLSVSHISVSFFFCMQCKIFFALICIYHSQEYWIHSNCLFKHNKNGNMILVYGYPLHTPEMHIYSPMQLSHPFRLDH